MTYNDELGRAVEAVDGFVQRWEARIGFGAQTSDRTYAVIVHGFDGDAELRASDLRLILTALRKQGEARALAASPPVGGWEDISTAPKDGTHFLAVDECGDASP